jgi:hypothetical protein
MQTCECKVSDSILKGVNKTVNGRLQTKWLDGHILVRMCERAANYTNSAYIRSKLTK